MFDVCLPTPTREELVDQWCYVFFNWTPRNVYLLGTNVNPYTKYKIFREAICVYSADELPGDQPIIKLDHTETSVPLKEFKHPETPIYLFGPDDMDFDSRWMGSRTIDHTVHIAGENVNSLFSHVAGALTFYDREQKLTVAGGRGN
jgi:hypothetical protein